MGRLKTEVLQNVSLKQIPIVKLPCAVNFMNPVILISFSLRSWLVADAIDSTASKIDLLQSVTAAKYRWFLPWVQATNLTQAPQVADISKTHTCPWQRARKRLRMAGIDKGVAVVFSENPVYASKEAVPGSLYSFLPVWVFDCFSHCPQDYWV